MNAGLILLRHGAVEGMTPERFRGRADLALSVDGERQASAAAARVAAEFAISAIYASPLRRCVETAAFLEADTGIAPKLAGELVDIDYGDWTGRLQSDMAAEQPEAWEMWREAPERVRFPHGEGLSDVLARAGGLFSRLARSRPGSCTALVTHDSVIRAFVIQALGLQPSLYHRLKVSPASLTELTLVDGRATLTRLNDIGHLE
jgi:probable phosphoglycerate mutase